MSKDNESFAAEIWNEFVNLDISEHVKHLKHANNAAYLPWSDAWSILMQRYPESMESFKLKRYKNGSVEVRCTLTIRDGEKSLTRTQFLPVMDGKNQAIIDPTARAISDTKQRALVKTLSKFGLGLHLYSGDELPKDPVSERQTGPINDEQLALLNELIGETGADVEQFCKFFKVEAITELPASKYKNAKAMLESKRAKQ
jgi:hypothetical protein